jgi:hypothetical protein
MAGFGLLSLLCYRKQFITETVIYALLALLFQPFNKLALGRGLWNATDVAVAVFLLLTLIPSVQRAINRK